jgi:hypothetical protein
MRMSSTAKIPPVSLQGSGLDKQSTDGTRSKPQIGRGGRRKSSGFVQIKNVLPPRRQIPLAGMCPANDRPEVGRMKKLSREKIRAQPSPGGRRAGFK